MCNLEINLMLQEGQTDTRWSPGVVPRMFKRKIPNPRMSNQNPKISRSIIITAASECNLSKDIQ